MIKNLNKYYKFQNKLQLTKKDVNKLLLVLPYFLVTMILFIIPTVLIFIKPFIPVKGLGVDQNWNYLDSFIWWKILMSLFNAFITTIVCLIITIPFCYLIINIKNKIYKNILIMISTAPIWTSFLVKLVGLKTFFDIMYGYKNSTNGNIFTIIGLIYLYLPFMIMPIYVVLNSIPKNIILASYDLGRNWLATFFNVVIPYIATAIYSGISLVFLPSLTTVAVPQFLNTQNDGSLIGDIIMNEGSMAGSSAISLARASSLSLVTLLFLLGFISIYLGLRFGIKKIKERIFI